jgi:hypothetical protein
MRRTFLVSISLAVSLAGPGFAQEKQYLLDEWPALAVTTGKADPAVMRLSYRADVLGSPIR